VSPVMDQINQLKSRLEFNEARFEAIAQTASDSIVISDENSIIVFANRKTYETFGYDEGELIGSDLGVLMPEKYRQDHRAGVQKFISTGNPRLIGHTIEIEGLREDGTVFPLELSLSSWKEEGRYFFSGIIRDITERKEAFREKEEANLQLQKQKKELEEAFQELQEARHLLQEITDAVPNVIYVSDFVTKKNLFVSKEVASLTGYTSDEVKSFSRDRIEQLIHPEDIIALQEQDKEFRNLKKGDVLTLNIRIKHKDGRWRWVRTKSKIFKHDGNGQPLQTIRIFGDVTEVVEAQRTIQQQNEELAATLEELQTAEEQLREMNEELEHRVEKRTQELTESERMARRSEEQLRLMTDAMPVLISYKGTDLTYKFINKTYETFFKIESEEIVGKYIWEVIGIKGYNKVKPLFERALMGEHINAEIIQLDIDGVGKKWFSFYMVPHREKEKVIGVFHLAEDITVFKNTQLELIKKNKELERANTDLDNFIYTASHDLKSPIINIEGLMEILKKFLNGKISEKEEKLFEMMGTSVQRLGKTIGDLVEVTKLQQGLEGTEEEKVPMAEMAQDVKEDIHHLIRVSNATIKEDFEVKNVVYKKSNLRSILYNLLSNAIKYRDLERALEIELKTFVKDDCIVLSVKDNGLGLNPNQQKKLFTLFRRMHQHVEGTGVGLYTIKRIVENNGGRIEVKSEEGKGTEFRVFLTEAGEKE
jgi:PAS domain S-box-containing protein